MLGTGSQESFAPFQDHLYCAMPKTVMMGQVLMRNALIPLRSLLAGVKRILTAALEHNCNAQQRQKTAHLILHVSSPA